MRLYRKSRIIWLKLETQFIGISLLAYDAKGGSNQTKIMRPFGDIVTLPIVVRLSVNQISAQWPSII